MVGRSARKRKASAMSSAYKAGMSAGTKRGRVAGRTRALSRMRARALLNSRTGGFLGLEMKFLDCAWNGVTINASADGSSGELQPSAGCTNCLSCPAQGDGESQRDGRKYVIKSVWVSGIVDTTPVATGTTATNIDGYFFALVLDTQANGQTVVSENVYLNPGGNGQNILPQPLRNLSNSNRFRILASKYVRPGGAYTGNDAAGTFSSGPQISPILSLSWKGSINVETTGTTADVASVADNAIHLIGYCGTTSFTPTFRGKSRMRFMG